jgi:hypothetical protein
MKNTLAENMLRFGSKNLSEENRKNLKQLTEGDAVITPHFKHNNGVIYRTPFKDTAQYKMFTTPPKLGALIGQQIDPNISTLENNYYLYAGAILQKVALAGKYNPADYKTPQIFRDYMFNTNDEAVNQPDWYDRILCNTGGHGNSVQMDLTWNKLGDDIDEAAATQSTGAPVPGQSPNPKFFAGWSMMLSTLNSVIPTRFNAVNSDPGIFWKNPSNKIELHS